MVKIKRKKKVSLGNPEVIEQNTKLKFKYLDDLIKENENGMQKKFEYINERPVFYNHDSIIFVEWGVFWIYTLPESRGKGNATKLMTEYIIFLTLLKEKRVEVSIKKGNVASIRMFEKIGFKRNMKETFRKVSRGVYSKDEIMFELDITKKLLDSLHITQEVLNETAIIYKEYDEFSRFKSSE